MSRTLAMTQILVILLSILALTVSSVSAQTQGNEIIIDEIVIRSINLSDESKDL